MHIEARGFLTVVFSLTSESHGWWVLCVGHAAWDALHFDRVGFVPDWYVAACLAVDIGLGAFVLLNLRSGDALS